MEEQFKKFKEDELVIFEEGNENINPKIILKLKKILLKGSK